MCHNKIIQLGIIFNLGIILITQQVHASEVDGNELDEIKVAKVISPKIDHSKQQEESEEVFVLTKNYPASTKQKIALGLVGLVGTGATFTLEVLGATGAFWGATDVFYLRDDTNDLQFRIAAMAIGGVAFIRYLGVHVLHHQRYEDYLVDINCARGLGKIVKAFEAPIPAVKTALEEIFCYKTKPEKVLPKCRPREHCT